MGIAVSIVSAVLKSVVGDKLGDGLAKDLIGISIDGISEKGIKEITDFINRGKSEIDNIFSKENMESMGISEDKIDYVVAEIKDLFSKVSITDEMLRQCKYDSVNLSAFLWDEYRGCKSEYIECESEIKQCLFAVAGALIKLVRESDDFEKDVLIHISNTVDEIRSEEQSNSHNLDVMFDKTFKNFPYHNMMYGNDIWRFEITQQKNIKTRTQEYAKKWKENMFLNNFNAWDENVGVNVKLSDVYIDAHLPNFIYGHNERISENLGDLLSRHLIKNNSKQLLNNNSNKMLLILGQPGIGKSTLITWITAKFNEYIEDILVYKFAEDLKDVNWKKNNISKKILNKLNLSFDALEGKTLILDGFDEVNVEGDRRKVLDNLYGELIYKKNINNFSLIITCRENYIQGFEKVKCKYIILQPWDETQIRSFCNVFQQKTKGEISENTIEKLNENKEILGIPLILYMVLALNISVEKEGSIVDIYDKIFSLEGGIYDRCIDNKMFADKHRIGEIKQQIHQVSREIAMWMFENNSARAYIPKEDYQKICSNIMQKREQKNGDIQQDLLIGNYFKLVKHCDGIDTEELCFVHRSIYEYFVVETIYSSIESAMKKLTVESQEEFAGNIAIWLKQGHITYTISEYLRFKLLKLYNSFDCEKKGQFYEWWEEAFDKMISNGMFYYTKENIHDYKNIIDKEINCFLNLMKIIRSLFGTGRKKYVLENVNKFQLEKYIRFRLAECRMEERGGTEIFNLGRVSLEGVNLSGADIKMADLRNANLKGANLRETDLSKENFQDMDLRGANLEEANLQEADFRGADLAGVKLEFANLQDAIFDESQVYYLKDKYNLDNSKVYIFNEKKVISFESYCERINDR